MSEGTEMYADASLFCPSCQGDLAVAKPERGGPRPPAHRDQTVCSHCLTYLRYHEYEPGRLRLDVIARDEFEDLPEQLQAGLMQVRGQLLAMQNEPQPTRFETALAIELTAVQQRLAVLEAGNCSCHYCSSGDGLNCIRKRGR